MYAALNFGIFLLLLITGINGDLLQLKNGLINSTIARSKNGREFHQFQGIPFAEPPVGKLRFKPPIPAKSWSDVRGGSEPPKCVQPLLVSSEEMHVIGQEDCLYLNVFVPNDVFKPTSKVPVIVGIHGGGFKYGDGTGYNPGYLMDSNVIFVTMNYRLGVLGFLGMNNDVISGNFGMKDQTLALKWIKENIEKFGGDPGNVTLLGESSGAASVHLHMFSPLSKGLFHRAIMQSGSAFSPWSHHEKGYGEAMTTAFLVVTGCYRGESTKILKCLQKIPPLDFYHFVNKLYVWHNEPSILFKPMIESKVKNEPFLARKPTKHTYVSNVPWIIGINSGEGCLKVIKYLRNGESLAKIANADKYRFLPLINEYIYTAEPDKMDNITQAIIHYYFAQNDIGKSTAMDFVNMMTDSTFLYPAMKTVQLNHERQYVYLYDHRAPYDSILPSLANITIDLGICHADELLNLFRSETHEAQWRPEDKKISNAMLKFWINFATVGDPNGISGEKIWNPVKTNDIEYLHIKNDSVAMESKLLKDRFEFWESLPTGWNYT